MSASTTTGAGRRHIDSLPDEIKALIVRHCAAQDRVWEQKHATALLDGARSYRKSGVANEYRSQLPESSLGAIFAVSKSWSRIAAPFRFEASPAQSTCRDGIAWLTQDVRVQTVTDRQLESRYFRLNVVRRHGRLFRTIIIAAYDDETWEHVIHALPGLPNIQEVRFNMDGASFLNADIQPPQFLPAAQAERAEFEKDLREAIRDLLTSVDRLGVNADYFDNFREMLECMRPAPQLYAARSLAVNALVMDSVSELTAVGAHFPNLRRLELNLRRVADGYQDIEAGSDLPEMIEDTPERAFPRLRDLIFHVQLKLLAYTTSIADAHCVTLENLTIEASPNSSRAPRNRRTGLLPFVNTYRPLRRLDVSVHFSDDRRVRRDFLDSITPERFPVLESLTLDTGLITEELVLPEGLRGLLDRPGFCFRTPPPSYLSYRPPILDYARPCSRDRILHAPAPTTAPLEREIYRRTDEDEVVSHRDLRSAVAGTLGFLCHRFEDAEVQDDVVGMQRLAELLKEPTLERMFMES